MPDAAIPFAMAIALALLGLALSTYFERKIEDKVNDWLFTQTTPVEERDRRRRSLRNVCNYYADFTTVGASIALPAAGLFLGASSGAPRVTAVYVMAFVAIVVSVLVLGGTTPHEYGRRSGSRNPFTPVTIAVLAVNVIALVSAWQASPNASPPPTRSPSLRVALQAGAPRA